MQEIRSEFGKWLTSVLPEVTPKGVIAFNFNLSEIHQGYAVEVCGSSVFSDTNSDWACDESWTCRPSEFRIADTHYANWETAVIGVVQLVEDYINSTSGHHVLAKAEAVAVGFVDGELIHIYRNN